MSTNDPQATLRREAIDYVEAVVARAEGTELPDVADEQPKSVAARLFPGSVKRAFVRALIYLLRHPFEHLAHPMRIEAERQDAELRALVHAAHRRSDQAYHAIHRNRPELEVRHRTLKAAIEELRAEVQALREKADELDRGR
jgi:hypothetical protein